MVAPVAGVALVGRVAATMVGPSVMVIEAVTLAEAVTSRW